MKRFALLASIALLTWPCVASAEECTKRVAVMFGCIEVPCSHRVVQTGGHVDYWIGSVTPETGAWTATISGGTSKMLSEEDNYGEVIWMRYIEEGRADRVGVVRYEGAELLVLSTTWFEYSVPADTESGPEILARLAAGFSHDRTACVAAERSGESE